MPAAYTRLPAGKLPAAKLEALLAACRIPKGSRVVVGPGFGEDAAVIDIGPKYLVAKTDPITFTAENIGWYAVNVNANDISTVGARPRWFLATLLLPQKKSTAGLAERIFADILQACRALGVTLCGGHTEITVGLNRPIVVGQMLGEVEKEKLVRKESQRPGDLVILTKGIALEGTTILAREKAAVLKRKFGASVVRRAQHLLFDPGISVVREAMLAVRTGEIHAMHDPTEGGLLSGAYELARAGDVGIRIWKDKVPILPETQLFGRYFGFDPFALIASGALLVVVSARTTAKVLQALVKKGVGATIIGEILPKNRGLWTLAGNRQRRLRPPRRDEIARLLE
jgi:hydrogenase expression/formation protein HypE